MWREEVFFSLKAVRDLHGVHQPIDQAMNARVLIYGREKAEYTYYKNYKIVEFNYKITF